MIDEITKLGDDPAVHGILLQHPVPEHIDERAAFEAIPPGKDVDGVTAMSFAAAAFPGEAALRGYGSCTPEGIMRLLGAYRAGRDGAARGGGGAEPDPGQADGDDAARRRRDRHRLSFQERGCCPSLVREADLVVAAVGRPEFVKGEWVREGAIVVDAGYNPGNVGDVEYEAAAERASWITPVPGGVGPMTIATLIAHTADAAERR